MQALEAESERRRGSARERGYTSAWDKFALGFKALNPLCVGCEAVELVRACEAVDHIEPHDGDAEKFWRPGNHQSACNWHHDKVKQILEARWRRGEIAASALRLDSPEAIALTRELMEQGERP